MFPIFIISNKVFISINVIFYRHERLDKKPLDADRKTILFVSKKLIYLCLGFCLSQIMTNHEPQL